ncbi:MAG: DUF1698 domain-containing protein [Thiolinea sp.]
MFGLQIDTEWRSDWKWQRVAPHLEFPGRTAGAGCRLWQWLSLVAHAWCRCCPGHRD